MTDQKSMLETALSEVCKRLPSPCDLKTFITESFLASEEKKGEWWSAIRSILAKQVREMGDSECPKKKLWNKVYALLTEARLASHKNPTPKIIIPVPTPVVVATAVENREPFEILQELVEPAKVSEKKRKREEKKKKKAEQNNKKKEKALKKPPHKKKKVVEKKAVEIISRSIEKSAELLRSFDLNPDKRFLYNAMIEQHLRHETINAPYCFSPTESMIYFLCVQAAFKKHDEKTKIGHVYPLCKPFFKIFNWGLRTKATVSKKYTALLYYADRDFGKYVEKDLREYAEKTFLKERLDVIDKCITLFQGNSYEDFCDTTFPKLQLQYFPNYYHPNVYLHGYKYSEIGKSKRKNKARAGVLKIADNAEKAYTKMRLFAQNCTMDQPRLEDHKVEEEAEADVDAMAIDTSPLVSSSPPPLPVSETIVQERIISYFFFLCIHAKKKYMTHKKN